MGFFQCALSIHHVGHISFWDHSPTVLAVVPHIPRSSAWSVILRVMARWPAKAEGHGVCSFAGQRWGRRDLAPGADGRVGVKLGLEPTRSCVGTYGAAIRPTLDLGWQLDAERRRSRGGGVQEFGYSLQQHVRAALQQPVP